MTYTRFLLTRPLLLAAASVTVALSVPALAGAAPSGLFEGNSRGTYNTISEFTIGSGNLLTPFGSTATGAESWLLAASPNGKYLYGSNYDSGTVSEYRVMGAALTPLSPASVNSGADPTQIAVSPNGRSVYVADESSAGLSVFDVGSGGVLSLAHSVTEDLEDPSGVAVSPDGSSVFVASYGGAITEFKRSSSGELTPKSKPTVPTGLGKDINLVITPNGRYLYASGSGSAVIEEYRVGSGGELSPLGQSTATEGYGNYQMSVSPNGKNLYASSCVAHGIDQYRIATDGELSALSPALVVTADGCPSAQWMTANGSALYASDYDEPTGDVDQFTVSATGALRSKSPAVVPAGDGPDDVMIAPDQGPVAKFSVKAGRAGKPTRFNASRSHAPDGKVVRYAWRFGHTKKTTRKPTISHTFKNPGKYKVSLTVTDDSGCSTTQVFTGQTAYCNGSRAARATRTVKVRTVKS